MRARFLFAALGVAVVLAPVCPPVAHATQVMALDLPDLGRSSALVVEARVAEQRSFWNESRTRILTAIDLEIDAVHKGSAPSRVSVVQAGGEVDGVRMTVHGIAQWRADEQVLLFLEPAFDGRYRVTGFTQGKFVLQDDPVTGERLAVRGELGVSTIGASDREIRLPLRRVLERALPTVREER